MQLIGASWKSALTQKEPRRHLGSKISLSVLSSSPKSSCGQNTILLTKQLRICASVSAMSYQGWGGASPWQCQAMLTIDIAAWQQLGVWKLQGQGKVTRKFSCTIAFWNGRELHIHSLHGDLHEKNSWWIASRQEKVVGRGHGNILEDDLIPDVSPRGSRNDPQIFSAP